jgi:hypothetical protein
MRTVAKKRWYFIPPLIIAGITAFGFITMALWNALLPEIFHLPTINFWQALGLLVLSRLLFGGSWHKGGHPAWKNRLKEKWEKMTPEEREQFRQRWHHPHPWDNCCKDSPKEEKKDDIA